MLGSVYNTRIQRSTDGGLTFRGACRGIPECGTNAAPFFTKIVSWEGDPQGDVVYTAANEIVYKSTNYARRWGPLGTAGLPPSPYLHPQPGRGEVEPAGRRRRAQRRAACS